MMLKGKTSVPIPLSQVLDSDYLIYEGAMAVAPSAAWRTAANQLFVDWKAALGVDVLADAMDIAYIFAAETEQAALLNMVKRAHDATNVNAVAFEASRGFTGNGTTSYLDTNYGPSTQAVNYTLNNAGIGIYSRSDVEETSCDVGMTDGITGSSLFSRTVGNFVAASLNDSGLFGANTQSDSLIVADRPDSNTLTVYRAGISIASDAISSSSIPNATSFYVCARSNSGPPDSFSIRQYAAAFVGRSMSTTEQLATYNAWQTFLTAIGAQV